MLHTSRRCWLLFLLRQDTHGRASELHHNRPSLKQPLSGEGQEGNKGTNRAGRASSVGTSSTLVLHQQAVLRPQDEAEFWVQPQDLAFLESYQEAVQPC